MNASTELLVQEWNDAGLQRGDMILLHSNLRRTLKRFLKQGLDLTPNDILNSFLQAIGTEGTLLLPLFNFDFTRGVPFNIKTTPSQMGVLTEAGRNHPLAIRTGHPIYSFCAIGYKAKLFDGVNNFSGYGADSPFGMLRELGGKISVLNLHDQNSMTFYHHVEEMNNVDYRYHKEFTGLYTDMNNKEEIRTYGLFVRDLNKGVLTDVNPMGELLWKEGIYTGDEYDKGSGLRVALASDIYEYVSNVIKSGKAKGLLYSIEGEANA